MRWNWEEDQSGRLLLYGSILFQIFVPASTKIQTIWIVQIRKKFGLKECNLCQLLIEDYLREKKNINIKSETSNRQMLEDYLD